MKRKPMKKNVSKKVFKMHSGTHKKNLLNPRMMRGGIRL